MIVAALAVLVVAAFYWRVLPERIRPVSLLLFGSGLYWAAADSIVIDVAVVMAILLVLRFGPDSRRSSLAVLVALVGLGLNKYAGVPSFQVIGLSYVTFRLISLARAASKLNLRPSLIQGLFYALFPPTFLAGPIEPYERFEKVVPPERLTREAAFRALLRIASGLAKKLAIAGPLGAFAAEAFLPTRAGATLWSGLLAYSLFVYVDFSAYSDLAIGGARLFGYSIGENFNWPYLSGNISEFWTRWHISLSQFLRDHVFIPLSGRALKVKELAHYPLLVGTAASLVTMTLCGMWHGDRGGFVVWGFGHGLLLAFHQLYRQKGIGRLKAKERMKLQSNLVYRGAGIVLTFLAVTLLWVPFRFSIADSALVYGRLFSSVFQRTM